MKALAIIGSIMILISILVWLHRRAKLYNGLAEVAQRYRGEAYSTWLGSPRAKFSFRDVPVHVAFRRRSLRVGGHETRVALDWPDRRFQMVVWSRRSTQRRPHLAELQPVPIDHSERTQDFEIWSNDPALAQSLLTPACSWQLRKVLVLATKGHLQWTIRRGKFFVHVGGLFRNVAALAEVVSSTLELFAQAQLTQQHGMDFIGEQSAQVIDQMICPVCSGRIGDDVVVCVRCRAPHCKECWQYNGRCATFACGAEKYISADHDDRRINPFPAR